MTSTTSCRGYFYPRPPRGGRLAVASSSSTSVSFLSTPSARRATSGLFTLMFGAGFLSTPSARRATSGLFTLMFGAGFLSTPSARRATKPAKSGGKRPGNFYPRPPRGGRPLNRRTIMQQVNFYPRPPRGGRPLNRRTIMQQVNFYPRPPRGGRLLRQMLCFFGL